MRHLISFLIIIILFSCSDDEISETLPNNGFLLTNVYQNNAISPLFTYNYDTNNRLSNIQYYNSLNTIANYTYDISGQLTEINKSPVNISEFGGSSGYVKITFTYLNSNEFIMFYKTYDNNNTLLSTKDITIQFDGDLIKSSKYYQINQNDYYQTLTFEHDDEGRLIKRTLHYDNPTIETSISNITSWDDNQNPAISSGPMRGIYLEYFPTKYISKKNILNTNFYSINLDTGWVSMTGESSFNYEYDDNGNTTNIYRSNLTNNGSNNSVTSYDYIPAN